MDHRRRARQQDHDDVRVRSGRRADEGHHDHGDQDRPEGDRHHELPRDGTYDSKSTDVFGNVTNTTGTSTKTETPEHKTTTDDFTSKTKDTEGNESTTTGTTTSVTDQKTGHRDTKTTYTTVGPDEDGNEQTVKGTTHSSVELNGHEVTTTIEVNEDGSGTKTVVTDGKTEEWTSDDAEGDTGWKPKKSDD